MSQVTTLQPSDDDERKLLIDVKRDAARSFDQTMITLSGGALALSLTFVQQLAEKPAQWRAVLIAAWLAFGTALVSILISFLLFQYAIDARIGGEDQPAWDRWTRRANWISLLSFGTGVVTLLIFCLKNLLR